MKSQRQAKILEIIATKNIETQEQLLEALQDAGLIEDLGCKVQSGYYMYPVVRWLR